MLNLNKRRAWAGSIAFTTISSLLVFLLFAVPAMSQAGQVSVARLVCFSIVGGLALEGIRRVKLAQARRDIARASDAWVMKVEINGVGVGEIPEPLYANMRMACLNAPRNYVVGFFELLGALWRHAVFTLAVTLAFAGLYLLASCLLAPTGVAQAILSCVEATNAHADAATALGALLHAVAAALANLFALFYLLLGGARMAFMPPPALLSAFHSDLCRRIRMTLDIPVVSETMSLHRARTA